MKNKTHQSPMDELGALADRWGRRVLPETLMKIGKAAGAIRRAAEAWDYDPDDERDAPNWRDVVNLTTVMFVAHAAREAPAVPQPVSVLVEHNGDMDAQTARGARKTEQAQSRRKSVAKPAASPSDASGFSRWLTTAEKSALDAYQPAKYRARAKPGMSVAQVLDWELFCDLSNRNFWEAVPQPRNLYNRRRWFAKNGVWHVIQSALNEPKSALCRKLGAQRRGELLTIVERLVREAEAIGSGDRRAGKFKRPRS